MRVIGLSLLVVALMITASPAQSKFLGNLFESVSTGISNVIGSVTNSLGNTIENIQNAINLATLGGQFLWDNALQPSLQTLTENGALFIDQYFGGLLNGIGKRDLTSRALIEAQRSVIKSNYLTLAAQFISNVKIVFQQLLNQLKETLMASIPAILSGELKIRDVLKNLIAQAQSVFNQLVSSFQVQISVPIKAFRSEDAALQQGMDRIFDVIVEWGTHAINYVTSYLVLGYTGLQNLIG